MCIAEFCTADIAASRRCCSARMLFSHDCTPHGNSYGICRAQRAMATVLLISIRELVIVSELDYCNSLLVGVSGTPLRWLQSRSSLPLLDWCSQLCCENNATPATVLLLHQLQSLKGLLDNSWIRQLADSQLADWTYRGLDN